MFGSPCRSSRHARTFSGGGLYSCGVTLADEFPLFTDRDVPEEADRVYTVDVVHGMLDCWSWCFMKVLFSSLFFFMQQGKHFSSCYCILGVAFFSYNCQQKAFHVLRYPLSLYVHTCVKCMALYLCEKYFELST
jgi:hypothetical protein